MTDYRVDNLPVEGDMVAPYVVIQQSPSGRKWEVKAQRFAFDSTWQAMAALDLSRPTRIVRRFRNGTMEVIRSWN